MKKRSDTNRKTVGDSFSIALLILLPSLTGMSLLAGPLYTLFLAMILKVSDISKWLC